MATIKDPQATVLAGPFFDPYAKTEKVQTHATAPKTPKSSGT